MVEITLKCVFCKNNLTYNTENKPKEGDMIKCHNCGKMNDYNTVVKAAIDNNKEKIKDEALNLVKKELQKSFKNTKIKLKFK